jgi:hypothetical protein
VRSGFGAEDGEQRVAEARSERAARTTRDVVVAEDRRDPPQRCHHRRISMEFADRAAYEGYNAHPDHVRFVPECWLAEVSDFLELDYEAR